MRSIDAVARFFAGTPNRRMGFGLMLLCAMIYLPFAGAYGLWDPWESHYSEIARQMARRGDYISLWWPGSPIDRSEVFHKPVLLFWLVALSMRLFGLETAAAPPDQMVVSWRVEWACRLPVICLSLCALFSIWLLVSRLAGRRAAALSTFVLATYSQWAFISRQVMTDIPFVAPMTMALCLGGLALLMPEAEAEAPLPRRQLRLLRWTLSYPQARAFWLFVGLFSLVTLPQLIVFSVQLVWFFNFFRERMRAIGLVPMLPYVIAYVVGLVLCARATCRRQLYLHSAYVLTAVASLAKGPAGLALPALVLGLYLVVTGRFRDLLFKLELPRGALLFIAAAFPWYHAMLLRHGEPFWNELIGDNYVRRAEGRHGDRGTFEYYMQWLGYGLFPWSGITAVAGLLGLGSRRERSPRAQLVIFALVWFVVDFGTVSMVVTKFHHYLLPALPALAILTGLFLDDLMERPTRLQVWALALIAVPLTLLSGLDLAAYPPRLLWEFNYDYVNMPGVGRPWPVPGLFGDRYEYGNQLMALALLVTLFVVYLVVTAARTRREVAPDATYAVDGAAPRRYLGIGLGAACLTLVVALVAQPKTPLGAAPNIPRWLWLVPALLMVVWFARASDLFRLPRLARGLALFSFGAMALVWTGFILDKVLVELSPHWAQKHVIASYYRLRAGPNEPLIAWQLYWRGENFYTRNEIFDPAKPAREKSVFLGNRNDENMKEFFYMHPNRKVFFVVERTRLESLRGLLPKEVQPQLKVVDQSNNKLYLATVTLPSGPFGPGAKSLKH